jgi:hypothetical protein
MISCKRTQRPQRLDEECLSTWANEIEKDPQNNWVRRSQFPQKRKKRHDLSVVQARYTLRRERDRVRRPPKRHEQAIDKLTASSDIKGGVPRSVRDHIGLNWVEPEIAANL